MIATKGGHTRPGPDQWVPDGRPEYLAQCVDKSLKRLKLERIDLYQLHRIDQGAGGRIVRRAEEGAGGGKNPARWIIGSVSDRNRAGEKGSADCQHPEPIQHRLTAIRRTRSTIARKKRWDSFRGRRLAAAGTLR